LQGNGKKICTAAAKNEGDEAKEKRAGRKKKKLHHHLSFFFFQKKKKKKSPGLVNFQAGWRGARTVFKSSIPSTVAQEKRRLWRTLQQLAKKNKKICATLGACTFKMAQELGIFQKSFPFMDHSLSSCFPLATMPGAPFRVWPSSRPERAPV